MNPQLRDSPRFLNSECLRMPMPSRPHLRFAIASALLVLAAHPTAQAAGVLDQQQTTYNGGMSARTLAGYSTWQSFTAGLTGTLTEIDMGFFGSMSGSATLRIRAGSGTGGAVLEALIVPVFTAPGGALTYDAWSVAVAVQAGSQYTFQITPDAATLPDPYGVALGSGNPYAGGALGVDDPSGTYPTNFDATFRTYVSAVPEPRTAALALAGAGVLLWMRKRRADDACTRADSTAALT